MVVRSLIVVICTLTLVIWASAALACFGPKLYWGVGTTAEEQVLFALATLYVQEKTGVESVRVELDDSQNPLNELDEERVDLAFSGEINETAEVLLQLKSSPALVSGERPLVELQFTTVVPAIRKLAGLLTAEDVEVIKRQVAAGESPKAAARRFLMERRWI